MTIQRARNWHGKSLNSAQHFFKYRQLGKRATVNKPTWVQSLLWAEYTDAQGKVHPVSEQTTYSATVGAITARPVAQPPLTYEATVLDRQGARYTKRCLDRTAGNAIGHTDHTNCDLDQAGSLDQHANLELRETMTMGIGVFATAVIPSGTFIGLYTGDLRERNTLSPSEISYSASISLFEVDGSRTDVEINALQQGNWTRFCNHRCNNNAILSREMNCGHMAVVIVRAVKEIHIGEEVSVRYGDGYFRDQNGAVIGDGCICGYRGCEYRPGTTVVDAALATVDETEVENSSDETFGEKTKTKKPPARAARKGKKQCRATTRLGARCKMVIKAVSSETNCSKHRN